MAVPCLQPLARSPAAGAAGRSRARDSDAPSGRTARPSDPSQPVNSSVTSCSASARASASEVYAVPIPPCSGRADELVAGDAHAGLGASPAAGLRPGRSRARSGPGASAARTSARAVSRYGAGHPRPAARAIRAASVRPIQTVSSPARASRASSASAFQRAVPASRGGHELAVDGRDQRRRDIIEQLPQLGERRARVLELLQQAVADHQRVLGRLAGGGRQLRARLPGKRLGTWGASARTDSNSGSRSSASTGTRAASSASRSGARQPRATTPSAPSRRTRSTVSRARSDTSDARLAITRYAEAIEWTCSVEVRHL